MSRTPQQKMSQARQWLSSRTAFYGARIIATPCIEKTAAEGINTMATDGSRIYWNADFVAKISLREIIGVLVHEMMHNMFLHSFRFELIADAYMKMLKITKAQAHDMANRAMDYAINPLVIGEKFKLPEGGLLDNKYNNMAFEEIMKKLSQDKDFMKKLRAGDLAGGTFGEVMPAPGTPDEQKAEENKVKAEVRITAISAKSFGKEPGWMKKLLSGWDEAQIDWVTRLHRIADRIVGPRMDSTWSKPNKRYMQGGMYLPARRRKGVGTIVGSWDVSGSVSDDASKALLSEMAHVVNEHEPEQFILIQFTTQIVCEPDVFEAGDEFPDSLMRRGTGGTNFRPQFKWIEDNDIKPDMFICLTDGEAPWPEKPNYPVIWVMTTDRVAPFGDTVHIKVNPSS